MTNIETIRQYCLSLPHTSEDMAFGEDCLLFRVCDKIFACYIFGRDRDFVIKCDPDYALDLRDRYPDEIQPAWHWNKKYWNELKLNGPLSEDFIKSLIRHSYSEVLRKLPKRTIVNYPEMAAYIEQA